MIVVEALIGQFLGSSEASSLLAPLQQAGLSPTQAQGAVTATAEGAAQVVQEQGVGVLGGGGVAGALGALMGGGGLGAGLSALTGGGAAAGGLPAALIDPVVAMVASKTGLSPELARTAVNVVLPQVVSFVKARLT